MGGACVAAGKGAVQRLRLDPRTKIALMLAVNVVMMGAGTQGWAIAARITAAAVPCALLVDARRFLAAAAFMVFYGAVLLGEPLLLATTSAVANLVVLVGAVFATRIIPSFAMLYYVVRTTKVSELVAALERMRVPRMVVIPLSVMFRFIPTVLEEVAYVSDSMRMRGLAGAALWRDPVAALEYRMVPLMSCVVKIGEELSAAALTRGLGNPGKRTNICVIGFGWADGALAFVAGAALCLMAC